jgi:hypothetical protein
MSDETKNPAMDHGNMADSTEFLHKSFYAANFEIVELHIGLLYHGIL